MQGNNAFYFNHITMREIVQHYLDTVLLKENKKVVVTGVEYSGSPERVFKISIAGPELEVKVQQ